MNYYRLTWHLVRKDIGHQWLFLCGLWGLAFLIPLRTWLVNFDGAGPIDWVLIPLFCLTGFFILIRLIHLDPPGRDLHFLATRAVSWFPILFSKLIFIGLFLIIPLWIARLLTVYAAGIPYGLADAASFLLETGLQGAAFISLIALFAMLSRTASSAFFAGLIYIIFLCTLVMTANALNLTGLLVFNGYVRSIPMAFLTLCLVSYPFTPGGSFVFILAILGAAWVRYRYRTLVIPLILFATGLVSGSAVSLFTYDQLEPITPQDQDFYSNLKATFPSNAIYTAEADGVTTVMGSISISGFKSPYYGYEVDLDNSQATLDSGRVLESLNIPNLPVERSALSVPSVHLERLLVGIPNEFGLPTYPQHIELFQTPTPLISNIENKVAIKLTGSVTMQMSRIELLPIQLPLKTGATMECEGRHYKIEEVSIRENGIYFRMDASFVPVQFTGSEWTQCLIYNSRTGESMTPMGSQLSNLSGSGFFLSNFTEFGDYKLTRILPPGTPKRNMQDWLNDAHVAIFVTHNLQPKQFTFDLSNVSLISVSHRP